MSGHNKWSTIKRKKGAIDAKRGALFTKLIKEIMVAARNGGEDMNSNARLRTAVLKARANNMPNDNIERAIKKATGNVEGAVYEEIRYEGYGPGGVAVMVDTLTDNKNRTSSEVRSTFSKHGGNLGETGCVGYLFERKGVIIIEAGQTSEDEVIEMLMDFDILDIRTTDGNIEVTTSPESFYDVSDALTKQNLRLSFNEISMVPQTTVALDEKKAIQTLKLIEVLEDLDDVQNVYSNYDIPDQMMVKISEGM